MLWVFTAILCIVLIEVVVRMPFPAVVSEIGIVTKKALYTLGSKSISDHWKEKAMMAYAASMFTATMKLAGLMVGVGSVAYLLVFVFDYIGVETGKFIVSWAGICYSMAVAYVYFRLRKLFV